RRCIADRFETYSDYMPEDDSHRKQLCVDDQECVLDIFDTCGSIATLIDERSVLAPQLLSYYSGFLCVFALNNLSSLHYLREAISYLLRVDKYYAFVIVGTKSD